MKGEDIMAMRKLAALAVLLCVVAGGWACKEKPVGADERVTIAVIPKGTTHEFWKTVHAGAGQGHLLPGILYR